jgi:LEA14-like dessication related protein
MSKPNTAAGRAGVVSMVTLVSLLLGCATLNQIVQKPTVTFDTLNLENASLMESTLNFHFKVNNPNPIGLHASRITYALKLNGTPFTHGELGHGLSVPAGSVGALSIPVTVRYLDFFKSISDLVRSGTAAYDLSGTFAVGPFEIPFSATGSFDLPKMPKISLASVTIQSLSLSGARLNCRLAMDNPNAYALLFKHLDYDLKLGDITFARADAKPDGAIGQHGRSQIDVGLDVSFAQIGRAAYRLLMGNSSSYRIDGQMMPASADSRSVSIPFSSSGKVAFIH